MKTHTGFTLIEVLIAMLLLAVGLLGLAALQTATLRSNLIAYNHGQATQLLYDMSDRIRANNCKPNEKATPPLTCNYPTYASAASAYRITNSNNISKKKCIATTGTGCTPTGLADNDLIEWNDAIVATLPMGRGCIADNGTGIFNLYITWDDDRNGAVTTDVAVPTGCDATFSTYTAPVSGTFHDPVFTMSVQP